jgi:orotidine-5'-phosphate decarboxylase
MRYFGPKKTNIIFAADLPSLDGNLKLLDQIVEFIDVIKVCSPLIYEESAKSIRILADRYKKPIFADLKIADIPYTSANVIRMVRDKGGKAAMVHGFIGADGIMECLDAAREDLGIIIQLELTNPGGLLFTQPIANDVAKLASSLGVYGTQAPGNRPERIKAIRNIIGPEKIIVCCGVGHQGGTLSSVLESGGDYAIIGRAIHQSTDPVKAIQQILRTKNKEV